MPQVWENTTRQAREYTAAEIAQQEADILNFLPRMRERLKERYEEQLEEGVGAELSTTKRGNDLLKRQLNMATRAQVLARKEAAGTATAQEIAQLNALDVIRARVQLWRDAKDNVEAALDAAGNDVQMTARQRRDEIEAVTPIWPT